MKRLAMLLAVPALTLALITAGCGSGNEQPTTGVEAAANCLRDGGAKAVEANPGELSASVVAEAPNGGAIQVATSDADTIILTAQSLSRELDAVTWLTPDHQAIAAGAGGDVSTEDWRLAMSCALILPDDPGKGNQRIELGEMLVRREWNAGLVDWKCDLHPGRAGTVIVEYALAQGIGPRRMQGYMYRLSNAAAGVVLDGGREMRVLCRDFRSARFPL